MELFNKLKIFAFSCFLLGCNNSNEKVTKITSDLKPYIKIEIARDTIRIDQSVKGVARIYNSKLESKNSQIIVLIEADENQPLNKDLSNEYDIPLWYFHNLSVDTINQKWIEFDNPKYVSAFEIKFKSFGSKKLNGYVLDFYDFNPKDTILSKKSNKYYFEIEVYVTK